MLIVAGHFTLDPADRDAFLEGRADAMRETRTEGGNLEYVMSADPLDRRASSSSSAGPTRSRSTPTWLSSPRPSRTGPAPKGFEVKIYDIAGERSFG